MKYKKKYEVNISVILIVGVVFLIWGMSLLVDGVTIRKNLKNIYSGDVNVSKLKEGNYITVDKVKVLGKRENGMESYSVWEYVSIEPLEYRYYMVSVNESDNQYISLMIKQNQFCELDDNVDEDGYMTLSDEYDVFHSSYDFKVVEADANHLNNIQYMKDYINNLKNPEDIGLCDKVALIPINYAKERKVLIWAFSVLFCALMLIIASKPWKIIEIKYIPEREFNLVYKEENDESDMTIISELASSLRNDVHYYQLAYDKIKKNVISFGISILIFFIMNEMLFEGNMGEMIFQLGILIMIPAVLFVKFLINMVILLINQDTHLARSIMSIFNTEPIMSTIHERQAKLVKCDNIIKENLYKKAVQIGDDM